jgi:hypothetical protein
VVRFLFLGWLVAAAPALFGHCPVQFRTESSANLATGAGSHFRVARQSDGSYTGYEIADAAPYGLMSVVPGFASRLTRCNLTNSSFLVPLPEAITRLSSGNYLYVADNYTLAPGSVILADFDGDGRTDVVLGTGNAQVLAGSRVTVLYNRGGRDFSGAHQPRCTRCSGTG